MSWSMFKSLRRDNFKFKFKLSRGTLGNGYLIWKHTPLRRHWLERGIQHSSSLSLFTIVW